MCNYKGNNLAQVSRLLCDPLVAVVIIIAVVVVIVVVMAVVVAVVYV